MTDLILAFMLAACAAGPSADCTPEMWRGARVCREEPARCEALVSVPATELRAEDARLMDRHQ